MRQDNNKILIFLLRTYERLTKGEAEMQISALFRTIVLAAGVVASLGSGMQPAGADYIQTNLVSDIPGLAIITDPLLQNPWGISRSPTSPFWVSNQETNTATLYRVTGATNVEINPTLKAVTIPTTGSGPQGPTGQVFNTGANFTVGAQPARFIFADLNGTISAWNQGAGTTAVIKATTPGAIYTGLAINNDANRLYAANLAGGGSIDVFDASFTPVNVGGFVNPFSGLVPFNVQNINGDIYVTYAPPGLSAMQQAQEGSGAVAIFDQNGVLKQKLIDVGRELASPWGLALAPAGFGEFGGDLLVGNFSFVESEINAFDPLTGAFEGTISIDPGAGNTPGGLWGLIFGNGGNGGDPNVLYIANGINGEENGLFAAISVAVPEPSSVLLLAAALSLLGAGYEFARRGA